VYPVSWDTGWLWPNGDPKKGLGGLVIWCKDGDGRLCKNGAHGEGDPANSERGQADAGWGTPRLDRTLIGQVHCKSQGKGAKLMNRYSRERGDLFELLYPTSP